MYPTPDFTGEPWYPTFLMVSVLNFTVLWTIVTMDALKRGFQPRTGAVVLGGLGMLLMVTPPGFATWASMNLCLIGEPGIPIGVRTVFIIFPLTILVAFYDEFLGDIMRTIKQTRQVG